MDLDEHPPWSKKMIDRLGIAIRDGQSYDINLYTEFLLWSVDIIDEAQKLIQESLDISERLEITIPTEGIRVIEKVSVKLTGRPKTLDTTKEKLRRMPEFKLSRIQDICGLRLDGDFSLDQQNLIADRLETTFWATGAQKVERNDLRESSRQGYRAVHVNANFPAGRLEVQIRTKLQSAWANTFELVGDIYGREVRYVPISREPLRSFVANFLSISESAYGIDKAINQINGTVVGLKRKLDSTPKEAAGWKIYENAFLSSLGARAVAIGNQIDVVDSLDDQRATLIFERAGK